MARTTIEGTPAKNTQDGGANAQNLIAAGERGTGSVSKRTEYNRAFKAVNKVRQIAGDKLTGIPSGDALRQTLGNATIDGLRMVEKSSMVSGKAKDFALRIIKMLQNG